MLEAILRPTGMMVMCWGMKDGPSPVGQTAAAIQGEDAMRF